MVYITHFSIYSLTMALHNLLLNVPVSTHLVIITFLDLVLCNNHLCTNVNNILPPFSTSDHCIVDFTIYTPTISIDNPDQATNITLPVYDWTKADWIAINDCLMTIDWNSLFGYHFHPDAIWEQFKLIIWPIITSYVPTKFIPHSTKYKVRHYPKFIRNLISRKAAIWRRLRTNPTLDLKDKYTKISNECKLAISNFDAKREERILEANNLGSFYKFVNQKLSSSSGIAPLKSTDGLIHTVDSEKANLLNEYFHSVFTVDNGTLPIFPNRVNSPNNIEDISIDPTMLANIIKNLKSNSAAGPDHLPPIFFKKCMTPYFTLSALFFASLLISMICLRNGNYLLSPPNLKVAPHPTVKTTDQYLSLAPFVKYLNAS